MDLQILNKYLPNGAFYFIVPYFEQHPIDLIIKAERKTKLGDYCFIPNLKRHQITINSNLNQYAFLITLIHEIAHLIAFDKYKHTINPHGVEWKIIFKNELHQFLTHKLLPNDIEKVLLNSINNLKASSCSDLKLAKILKQYDTIKDGHVLVENIKSGGIFIYQNNRTFRMIGRVRSRYQCEEITTKRIYFFYALAEVIKMEA